MSKIPTTPAGEPPTEGPPRRRRPGESATLMSTLAAVNTVEQDPMIGRELAGYVIERRLAEGGMGVVYLGEHVLIGRKSAIKVLKQEFCENAEVVERFYQEARAVNEIKHENIIDIYDFGRDQDGRAFFVMELLVGESLGDRLLRGPLSVQESLPILKQCMKALAAAHSKGVTHRDLKPDNIWLRQKPDGPLSVKLLDFGIAKLRGDASSKMTKTGQVMGTPDYMSPEQINGDVSIDSRADLYSMGCIIFEMITQQTPFAGATIAAVMSGHLFRPPRHLDEAPLLAPVVQRLLAKAPGDRYQSAVEVIVDVDAISRGAAISLGSTLVPGPPTSRFVTAPAVTNSANSVASVATVTQSNVMTMVATRRRSPVLFAIPAVLALALGGVTYWKLRPHRSIDATVVAGNADKSSLAAPKGEPPAPSAPLDPETIRRQAIAVIRSSIEDPQASHRAAAVAAIGDVRDRDSVKDMLAVAVGDQDVSIRGAAANTLGLLGDVGVVTSLRQAEGQASTALQVWYAAAQSRLGQADARPRLETYAASSELSVALKATLELAELSQPGDQAAIGALQRLVPRETDLNQVVPYSGVVLLAKLARLRQPKALDVLYSILGETDESARVAAAVGLAQIGDDAGKQVLIDILANPNSPNQMLAGKALLELGDYSAFTLFNQKLAGNDDSERAAAAIGLGKIAELSSVQSLLPLLADTKAQSIVKIAAARGLMLLIGAEPTMLAQSANDWTKRALDSEDLAVRSSGASNIGNLAGALAAPLLAQALSDKDVSVRRMAARSAGRIRTTASAQSVLAAVANETDAVTKEEMVASLGRIGDAIASDALFTLATADSRLGMLASGSLVAVGNDAGVARLQAGIASRTVGTRLAAIEGSALAHNPAVVSVLLVGVKDKDFAVRFAAAEALASYENNSQAVIATLQAGLGKKDLNIQTRALRALNQLNIKATVALNPKVMLDAPYATVRLSALKLIALLPWAEARPLLLRASADPSPAMRLAVLEQLESRQAGDGNGVLALSKGFVDDRDPAVRAAAQAMLSKHAKSMFNQPTAQADVPSPAAAKNVDIAAQQQLLNAVGDAVRAAKLQVDEVSAICRAAEAVVTMPNPDEASVERASALSQKLEQSSAEVIHLIQKAEVQLQQAKISPNTAGPQLATISGDLQAAQGGFQRLKDTVTKTKIELATFTKNEKKDADLYLASANAALATGRLSEAKADLDKANAGYRAEKINNPNVDFGYGQLWDKLAQREKNISKRVVLLRRAKIAFDTFSAKGIGKRAKQAAARSLEISEELAGGK